jgi:Ras-related protein Rab-27A
MMQHNMSILDYDYLLKFLTIGDSGVGKTCFLYQYTDGVYNSKFISTVGIDFREKRVVSDKFTENSFWVLSNFWLSDVHAQGKDPSDFPTVVGHGWPREVSQSDHIVLSRCHGLHCNVWHNKWAVVFGDSELDWSTEGETFLSTRFTTVSIWKFQTHAYCETPDIVLCGNKCDLNHKRVVSQSRGQHLAQKNNITYIEISSYTGHNVDEAVNILIGKIMVRLVIGFEVCIVSIFSEKRSRIRRMEDAIAKRTLLAQSYSKKAFDESLIELDESKQLDSGKRKQCLCWKMIENRNHNLMWTREIWM